ncbi:MAG: hypothetical protein QW791_07815, partial [Candidatus Bathyarchaeia archaeon]
KKKWSFQALRPPSRPKNPENNSKAWNKIKLFQIEDFKKSLYLFSIPIYKMGLRTFTIEEEEIFEYQKVC